MNAALDAPDWAAVLRLEMKKTLLLQARLVDLLPGGCARWLITLVHWLTEVGRRSAHHSMGDDSMIFAGAFLFFFLRGSIFFGCMGIFSNLFRGEMLAKTLHYYLLTPMRREVLVAGKYAAGLAVALVLFVGSTALSFLLIGRHFGPAWSEYVRHGPGGVQLGAYALAAALACIGYGAVFLLCGLLFRNPLIPTAAVWVWEDLTRSCPRYSRRSA